MDILWGAHPHVVQGWEIFNGGRGESLIIYSLGNLISGQRYRAKTNKENPSEIWQYTGDSVILQAELLKTETSRHSILEIRPVPITTHIDENNNFIIKQMTDEFIKTQEPEMSAYYTARKKLMGVITNRSAQNSAPGKNLFIRRITATRLSPVF